MMRRRSKHKPAAVQRHHDRITDMPCLVCKKAPPSTRHHVTGYADRMGRFSRDEFLIVPLCEQHHLADHDSAFMPVSVGILGHRGFFAEHGIDLLKEAIRLRDESLALERDAA